MPDFASVMAKSDISAVARAQGDEEDKDIDETGVEPRDIDLVMTQAGVSKDKAVKALKTYSGDRVSAIMAHNIDKLYDLPWATNQTKKFCYWHWGFQFWRGSL